MAFILIHFAYSNPSATDVADFPKLITWRTVRSLISSVYFVLLHAWFLIHQVSTHMIS